MVDEFDDYEIDEAAVLGLKEKGPYGYRVRTLQQYGNGDVDPFCRLNLQKRAVRTRIGDRDIEYSLGRGGDTAHLVMETGEPDTQMVGEARWVTGEEVDTKHPEFKYPDEDIEEYEDDPTKSDDERQELQRLWKEAKAKYLKKREKAYAKYLEEKTKHFREMLVPGSIDSRLLTDDQVQGIMDGRPEEVLERVVALDKGKFEVKFFAQVSNCEGGSSSQYITTERLQTKLEPDPDDPEGKRLRAKFRPAQMAIETDELSEGVPQEAGRLNFHMVSKLHLDRELALLYRQGRETPTKRVPYPRAGCSPIGNLKSSDEVSWRDAEYRRAILLKRTGKHGERTLRRRQVHDLPHGLYYNKHEGEYEVMIGRLNLHGRRIIAHNRAERRSRRAKEVYEQLMEALVNQAVRGRLEDRLTAWEILAKYGEDGLMTGSRMFYKAIYGSETEDPSWIHPDDAARGRAFRRFAYDNLYRQMRAVLHAAYHVDPAVTSVDDYIPFWTENDHEVRYGDTWETIDLDDENIHHRHKPWIKLVNSFVETNFDRSFPSEQYQYAKMLSRIFGAHDKKSFRSKAKANQRLEALTIHVIKVPTVTWGYEPDGKGGGEWKLHIDWSTFDYFAEGIEAIRDWVRMIGEWKFTKSARNSYDAMSFETRTADSLRGNDWGGIWNPVPYSACWSFWLEYLFADSRPSVLDEHGMPQFEGDRNPDGSWIYNSNFRRVWKRRAPMPIMPADPFNGPPKRDSTETYEEWQDRVVAWNARYSDDKPVRLPEPVRAAGESDEDWKKRYKTWMDDWNKIALEWQLKRDDRWIADLEAFNKAIDKRVVFMGWAWYDRDPDADMPHDGALRQQTAQKWADWLAMIVQTRGFNSLLGDGLVPDLTIFIKEQSSRVRNYRNETHWMESDEGAHHDPQAFWGYMGGLLRAHVVSMINYRLQAFRDSPDFHKILFKITDARNESATTIRDQLTLMWENAPLKGVKRRLQKLWNDALEENVIHVRPLYYRFLNGLPDRVVARLGNLVRGMNRRSDLRVRLWAVQMLSGIQGGKRALMSVNKFLEEGYGTNTGNSSKVEQRAQDELGFAAWMNGQYDKAIWFIRGVTLENEIWKSVLNEREHIIKLVSSGLSLDVTWEVIEILSEHGFLLEVKDLFPTKEKFKANHTLTQMEKKFSEFIKEHLGAMPLRAVLEGVLFDEMKKQAA